MEIINLDMTPSTVTPNAHAGQYDASRTVRFMLKNGGVPFTLAGTETITAEITRSDNTEATVNVANTSSNYVDVVFDDTVCTVKGLYACELRLKDSDGFDIGSKNFALLVQRDPYDGKNVRIVTVGPADICTFETSLAEPLQSVLVNIVATGGNGTPENPNPINGYTEANITKCGVNLWDKTTAINGYIDDSDGTYHTNANYKCTNFIKVSPSTSYYVKSEQTSGTWGAWYDEKQTFIVGVRNYANAIINAPSNACYIRLTVLDFTSGNIDTFGLNLPSTDTSYHPYTGNTYTVAFGQTVYGGVLDVTRGKFHVDTFGFVADNSLTVSREGASGGVTVFKIVFANNNFPSGVDSTCISSHFSRSIPSGTSGRLSQTTSEIWGAIDTSLLPTDDSAGVKAWLSTNDVTFYYEITPFDIDLTPEVISAVVGTNNVFADCGETTVEYLKAGD